MVRQKRLLFGGQKVESYLKEKFLHTARSWRSQRGWWSEGCVRACATAKFCVVCSVSLVPVLAPWALCLVEVATVLLIYFLAVTRQSFNAFHFSFFHNLEDIVGLACTRSALLAVSYSVGHMFRPYLYTAYLLAAACFPYILVKTILYRYSSNAVPAAVLFVITSTFCWVHVFAARRAVDWARRRYQLGLTGSMWDEGGWSVNASGGGESWGPLGFRRPDMEECSKASDSGTTWRGSHSDDVSPESLADGDSRFLTVGGIQVHYKQVVPCNIRPGDEGLGVVLVHGFAGGVFAWRNVMEPLAMQCHARVIAFDRPAFGLTSRPPVIAGEPNAYTPEFQSALLLALCRQLGLTRVIIAAHADGCLLALRAASLAVRSGAGEHHSGGAGNSSAPQYGGYHTSSASPLPPCASPTKPIGGLTGVAGMGGGTDGPGRGPASGTSAPAALVAALNSDGGSWDAAGEFLHAGVAGLGGPNAPFVSTHTHFTTGGGAPPVQNGAHSPQSCCEAVVSLSPGSAGSDACGAPCGQCAGAAGSAAGACASNLMTHWPSDGSHYASLDMSGGWMSPGGDGMEYQPLAARPTPTAGAGAAQDGGFGPSLTPPAQSHAGFGGTSSVSSAASVLHVEAGVAALDSGPRWRPDSTRHRRAQSTPSAPATTDGRHGTVLQAPSQMTVHTHTCGSARDTIVGCGRPEELHGPWPQVLGVALLHPNLSGIQGPALSRLLARSRLGRSILRPLLRSELGEVANRRAWHDPNRLTPEVLELYKAPLRVEGWCESLIQTTRIRREHAQGDLPRYLAHARQLPCLLLTGEFDKVSPPPKVELLSAELPGSHMGVVPGCGHLSHEEAPTALLATLVPFCGSVIDQATAARQQQQQHANLPAAAGPAVAQQQPTAGIASALSAAPVAGVGDGGLPAAVQPAGMAGLQLGAGLPGSAVPGGAAGLPAYPGLPGGAVVAATQLI